MNNIQQKNTIQKLISNVDMPYQDKFYVDHAIANYTLDSSDVNHSMQQLLDNDIYIERTLNATSSYMQGPKMYDETTIASKPNGYKAYGDVITGDCLDVLRKVEKPLSASLIRSASITGKAYFVCEFDNAVFVGSDGPLKYTTDIDEDEWHTVDGNITATNYCVEDGRLFLAAKDGVYQLSTYVDYELDENGQNPHYGVASFSVVKLNSSNDITDVTAVSFNKKKNTLCISANKNGKQHLYIGNYNRNSSLTTLHRKVAFSSRQLFKYDKIVQMRTNPTGAQVAVNDICHDTKNRTLVSTTNGVFVEDKKDQLTDRIDFSIGNVGDDIVQTCTCAVGDDLYVGTNHGLYLLNVDQEMASQPTSLVGNDFTVDSMLYVESKKTLFVAGRDSSENTQIIHICKGASNSVRSYCVNWPFEHQRIVGMSLFVDRSYKDEYALAYSDDLAGTIRTYSFQTILKTVFIDTGMALNTRTDGDFVGSVVHDKTKLVVAQKKKLYIYNISNSHTRSEIISGFQSYPNLSAMIDSTIYTQILDTPYGKIGCTTQAIMFLANKNKKYSTIGTIKMLYSSLKDASYVFVVKSNQIIILDISDGNITEKKIFNAFSTTASNNLKDAVVTPYAIIFNGATKLYWIDRLEPLDKQTLHNIDLACGSIMSDGNYGYILSGFPTTSSAGSTVHQLDAIFSYFEGGGESSKYNIRDAVYYPEFDALLASGEKGLSAISCYYAAADTDKEHALFSVNQLTGTTSIDQVDVCTTYLGNRFVYYRSGNTITAGIIPPGQVEELQNNVAKWGADIKKTVVDNGGAGTINCITHGIFGNYECMLACDNAHIYNIVGNTTAGTTKTYGVRLIMKYEWSDVVDDDSSVDEQRYGRLFFKNDNKVTIETNESKQPLTSGKFEALGESIRIVKGCVGHMATYFVTSDNKLYAQYCEFDEETGSKTQQLSAINSDGYYKNVISYKVQQYEKQDNVTFTYVPREVTTTNPDGTTTTTTVTDSGTITMFNWPDVTYFVAADNNLYQKQQDRMITSNIKDGEEPYYENVFNATQNSYDLSGYGTVGSIDMQRCEQPLMILASSKGFGENTFIICRILKSNNYFGFTPENNTLNAVNDVFGNSHDLKLNQAFFIDRTSLAVDYITRAGKHQIEVFYVLEPTTSTGATSPTAAASLIRMSTLYADAKNLFKCDNVEQFYMVAAHVGNSLICLPTEQIIKSGLADNEIINSVFAEIPLTGTPPKREVKDNGYIYTVFVGTNVNCYEMTINETDPRLNALFDVGAKYINQSENILLYVNTSGQICAMLNPSIGAVGKRISETGISFTKCYVVVTSKRMVEIYGLTTTALYKYIVSYSQFVELYESNAIMLKSNHRIMNINSDDTINNILHVKPCEEANRYFQCQYDDYPLISLTGKKGVIYPSGHCNLSKNSTVIKNNVHMMAYALGKYAYVTKNGSDFYLDVGGTPTNLKFVNCPNQIVVSGKHMFFQHTEGSNTVWRYVSLDNWTMPQILDSPTIYSAYEPSDKELICTSTGLKEITYFLTLGVTANGSPTTHSFNVRQIDTQPKNNVAFTYQNADLTSMGFGYFDLNANTIHFEQICCNVDVDVQSIDPIIGDPKITTEKLQLDELQISSCWLAGHNTGIKLYCQLSPGAKELVQTRLNSTYPDQNRITCDMAFTSCLNVCNIFKGHNEIKSIKSEHLESLYDEIAFDKTKTRTFMIQLNDVVSFTGFGYLESFDYDPCTGGCNCKRMLRDDALNSTYIASNEYIFKSNGYEIDASRNIPCTSFAFADFTDSMRHIAVNTLQSDVLSSKNGKLWKKHFYINGPSNTTINDVLALNKWTFAFATNAGLYHTKYQFNMVEDVKAFSQDDAFDMYDKLMTLPNNGICAQLCATLSNHIDNSHLSTSLISRLNTEFLTNSMEDIEYSWQTATDDADNLMVHNDIIQECMFGTYADGDIVAYSHNFLNSCDIETEEGYSTEIQELSYVMKRWMSGITELYISIPTTSTFYLPNQYGASNCKTGDVISYERKNLLDFGESIVQQDSTISTHYTKLMVGIASAEYSVDNLLDVQINGNSLPLKIYKDTNASKTTLAGQLYRSFIQPSICTNYDLTKTDGDGYMYFNFACFGSDAQAIRLMFYDRKARSNLPWIKIVFDPNGGTGVMGKQKFLITEDGLLEQKTLKKCKFSGEEDGRFFNGWTLEPQPDNYSWDSEKYDGTQKYDEPYLFPASNDLTSLMVELNRNLIENPFEKKEEITLYASWITNKFTTTDTHLTLDSNKTDFFIADVDVDPNTKLKDNVVINFGD